MRLNLSFGRFEILRYFVAEINTLHVRVYFLTFPHGTEFSDP